MPPKRKAKVDVTSGSESDTASLHRPAATALLPTVMRNIEMLKIKRDRARKHINAEFDAYLLKTKKRIEDRFISEEKARSTETKALLTRYIEALEKRSSIEQSIEDIVLNTCEDLKGLGIILEAAYSGRRQQSRDAVGSFASIKPVLAKNSTSAATTNTRGTTDEDVLGTRGSAQENVDKEERRPHNADTTYPGGAKHRNEERGGDIFDRISW